MDAQTQPQDSEQRYVEKRLVHIIEEAELQADMVAAFLTSQGYKPNPDPSTPPMSSEDRSRIDTFLLELGAGLRNMSLHLNKAANFIPIDLPTPEEGLYLAGKAAEPGSKPAFSQKMLYVTTQYLLPGARRMLGTDIVKSNKPASLDQHLNRFAAFLWERRGL